MYDFAARPAHRSGLQHAFQQIPPCACHFISVDKKFLCTLTHRSKCTLTHRTKCTLTSLRQQKKLTREPRQQSLLTDFYKKWLRNQWFLWKNNEKVLIFIKNQVKMYNFYEKSVKNIWFLWKINKFLWKINEK